MKNKIYLLVISVAAIILLFVNCKNKSMLIESYKEKSSSNVHWRYYLFNKKELFDALSHFNSLQISNDKNELLNIIDTLLNSLEKDYLNVRSDEKFIHFVEYLYNSDSGHKYIDLYQNLTKSKLLNLKSSLDAINIITDLDELKEYYIRYKASVFFKAAWFYLTKYHISDVFFDLFIDEELYSDISIPDSSEKNIGTDMYLTNILNKSHADKIVNNILKRSINPTDFILNDYIFYEGILGVLNDQYLIVYDGD